MKQTSTPAPRQGDDEQVGTKTFQLNLDGVVVTVTCNRPSTSALTNFTSTLHEILLKVVHKNQAHAASPPGSHE
ncbi:hypothetical protein [Alicyclobacillus sp. ALC3]|uniref:hypothetical protein n=1 Tax=Alicyclobacillus sp. ALC3 TaxID=2796143 RepID=UPI002378A871|nr:hypothetical protein [Alicyclobacillus sp. ALC3]WDL96742.1 hypothetical protein JC200_20995 [Alicyclobacillus sp. ALC3]